MTIGIIELQAASGATYRQLDHWTRRGVLECENPQPGSGTERRYPHSALVRAQLLVALCRCGFSVQRATDIAADLTESGRVDLGDGLALTYAEGITG